MDEETRQRPKGGSARERASSLLLPRTTVTEQTYEALKEMILDQTVEPGQRMNIGKLSKDLGVSSSPIREALTRLEVEGLVVSELYAGYRVAPPPDPAYLSDLLDYRIVVEGHAAEVGAPKRRKSVLQAMRQASERMAAIRRIGTRYREYRRFIQEDEKFHHALVGSAENVVLAKSYAALHAIILQSRLYLNRTGGAPSDEVVGEHQRILAAFEAGDGPAAREAVVQHLEGGRRRLVKANDKPAT